MPKRGILAAVLTVGALVLLLSFKTPDAPVIARSGGAAVIGTATGPAATPALGAAAGSPSGGAGGSATGPSAAATTPPRTTFPPSAGADQGGGETGPSTPPPAATPIPAATGAPGAPVADGTVVGDPVQIRWGTVQVEITLSGGKISAVTALQLPNGDRRSTQISSRAEPVLRQSALQAQSAAIDFVSGATFTSEAYAQSLQSALDRASVQG